MKQSKPTQLLVILAVIGTLLFIVINWWPMFTGKDVEDQPQIVVPSITKEEAAAKARGFVESRYPDSTLASFVTYQSDSDLSGYLQKNGLYEQYVRTYKKQFPIDYFQVELADKDNNISFLVDVNMDTGNIFGWTRSVPEEPAPFEQGHEIVEAAIVEMGYQPEQFTYLEENEANDGLYVLKNTKKTIGESALQLHIQIMGKDVVSFHPMFSLPEGFVKWDENQNKASSIMGLVSLGFAFLMAVGAIIFTVRYKEHISFSSGILLTLVFTVTYTINNMNMYPGFKALEGGGIDEGSAALFTVLFMNFIIFILAAALYLSFISGDAMWRQSRSDIWPRWKEASFGNDILTGMGRGYLVCLFILGVQAVLFLIAEKYFHVWSTNDPSSSPYNMIWPVLFPLMAWAAAISEEGLYRLFGIIVFKKLVRSTFLAVLLTSMIWALGHTSYPIYPVYTRFYEVTILGLIFGYTFLRYGFFTAVFAHGIMDSILMSFSLMSLGGLFNGLMGLFYIAAPALIAFVIYSLHQRFRKKPALHPEVP